MPNAIYNLTKTNVDRRLIKGENRSLSFRLSGGNRTSWTPYGEIRTNYKHLANELLGLLSFGTLIYNSNNNSTTIPVIFPWQLTENIRMHEIRKGKIIEGENVWVYEVDLTSPSEDTKLRVIQGYLEFNPMVISREV